VGTGLMCTIKYGDGSVYEFPRVSYTKKFNHDLTKIEYTRIKQNDNLPACIVIDFFGSVTFYYDVENVSSTKMIAEFSDGKKTYNFKA
jgi:hypothetical protein